MLYWDSTKYIGVKLINRGNLAKKDEQCAGKIFFSVEVLLPEQCVELSWDLRQSLLLQNHDGKPKQKKAHFNPNKLN